MRVLVVDDNESVRTLLEVSLGFDHEVVTANDGRQALEVLAADDHGIRVVLLDRMMPELDGIATLAAIRADERLAGLPVVLLTAKATDADVEEGMAAGADAYVTKPFDPTEVEELLERLGGADGGA